jgi:hypothetical protein
MKTDVDQPRAAASPTKRGAKTLLLVAMILLPGCLVITCGSSDLERREANPGSAEESSGSF